MSLAQKKKLPFAVVELLLMFALVSVVRGATVPTSNNDSDSDADWKSFKKLYRKTYSNPTEEGSRRAIRHQNIQRIHQHNDEANRGLQSYTLAQNEFSDWTPAEYQKLLGYKQLTLGSTAGRRRRRAASQPIMPVYSNTVKVSNLSTTVNWTTYGWVGPVMDQGQCGSCWAYSSIGAIEAQYRNRTQTWAQLSPQNLIDCSTSAGNLGCDGGNMDNSFWYVQTNGIESLADYPDVSNITGLSNETCKFNSSKSVTKIISWRDVRSGSEPALQQAVALVGPITAAIDASLTSFQLYSSGVYTPTGCSTTALNHAILVIGYGVSGTKPYWLIKNSWGTGWGMGGYMMMARNSNNKCGIASAASFPVI
jgi:C1A family cysteine protease